MAQKYVYFFGAGESEGTAEMKELLGGKGANLAEMSNLKIPVPAGFTISTEVCTYFDRSNAYPPELKGEVAGALARVEMSHRFTAVGQEYHVVAQSHLDNGCHGLLIIQSISLAIGH